MRHDLEQITLECEQLKIIKQISFNDQQNQLRIIADRLNLPSNTILSFDFIVQQIDNRLSSNQHQPSTSIDKQEKIIPTQYLSQDDSDFSFEKSHVDILRHRLASYLSMPSDFSFDQIVQLIVDRFEQSSGNVRIQPSHSSLS